MPEITAEQWLSEKEFREETLPEMKQLLSNMQNYLDDSIKIVGRNF